MVKRKTVRYDCKCGYCGEKENGLTKAKAKSFEDRHFQCMRRAASGLPEEPIHGGFFGG